MSRGDLSSYFRASNELRLALRRNREDNAFGVRPRRIVYFFDTNIALSHLLDRHLESSSPLGSLMDAEASIVSNRLSYQYMFSGKLPGMLDADTPIISQPHWNELLPRVRERAADIQHRLGQIEMLTGDERERLRALRDRPLELVTAANEIGLDRIIDQIKAATSFRKRVQSVIGGQNPRLVPLDRSPLWESVQDKVLAADVRDWTYLITQARRPEDRDASENIEADARTLASIEALYRENVDAIGPTAQLRFVFVTSNSAISQAYRARRDDLAASGVPDFIRNPLVYHPLLNFAAMHRALSADAAANEDVMRVFLDVQSAVGALFPRDADESDSADVRWRRKWNLEDNIKRWSSAAESIAAANIAMFVDDTAGEPTAQEIASYFESDDLFFAVSREVHRTIADIEEDHARHMAEASLDRLTRLLHGHERRHRERRAPMSFPATLDVLQGVRPRGGAASSIQTLDDLLAHLSHGNGADGGPSVADAVAEALRDRWNEPANQLLAAAIHMIVGAWESAISCADACVQTARRRDAHAPLAREARYCKAVSYRMLLRTQREIQLAREALNENLSARRRDPLLFLRDSVERSTLTLSACIVHAIEKSGIVPERRGRQLTPLVRDDDLQVLFDDEVAELDLALQDLSDQFLGSRTDPRMVSAVAGQAAVNRLGAELFRHFGVGQVSARPASLRGVFGRMVSILEDAPDYVMPLMGRVYLAVAEVELELGTSPARVIDEIDRRTAVTKLAHGDEHEYAFLRVKMAARASVATT